MTLRFNILQLTLLLLSFVAESQKISKNDKLLLAGLQGHVQSLSADSAGGRGMGMPGEKRTGDYIISELSQTGAKPKGDNSGWLQSFTIDEGRQIGADAEFSIDDQTLAVNRDWFPLTLSPAGQISGSPAIALQERGVPWFQDLKEILETVNGSHAGLIAAIRSKAAACAKKGATALILYNSSAHHADKLVYDPKEHPEPAVIPVLYLSHEAKRKYLKDESASVDLRIRISYTEQRETGHNVIGFLDFGAPTTVIVGTRYDNCSGAAAMLELAKMLVASKLRNNNFLFVVFSGSGAGRPGSAWFAAHPAIDLKKVNYLVDLNDLGSLNDTTHLVTVAGYASSPVWAPVWGAIRDKGSLTFRYDSAGVAAAPVLLSREHIPMLSFSTGIHQPGRADAAVNYVGELHVLKFIFAIIDNANRRGRLAATP